MRNIITALLLVLLPAVASAQTKVVLADAGQARVKITHEMDASAKVIQHAQTLARTLEAMSGAKFTVEPGRSGISLRLSNDFGNQKDPTRNEDYRIQTHAQGMEIVGATELALQHGVWHVLHELGHRQFFPGKTWEYMPKLKTVALAIDGKFHPDYIARSIWYGFGTWDYNAEPYREWCARNRMAKSIELSTGHAYDGILSRNKAEFAKHPEYLGLWKGERKSSHFCISNPGLRKLVVEDSLRQFAAKPDRDSISLEPSDGISWCTCEQCAAMGSVSDRALTLANEVAVAVTKEKPGRVVGMYAYSMHSPPPSIKVHPNVIVSVATAFVKGGYSIDQLMAGWQKQGATLGTREYYSVITWDHDLPTAARGSNLAYIQRTIPHFHSLGARYFSSESSDNWGCNGLGYYVASRLLWDVNQAKNVDAIVEDFLDKGFGSAKEPMKEFYRLLDGSKRSLLCDDLLGRLYRLLDQAKQKTKDPAVLARLAELTQYVRYVELFSDYTTSTGKDRQANFEQVIRHAYRIRKTMLVHTKGIYRDMDNRDKSVEIPEQAKWNVPEAKNPWKSSEPFSESEIDEILQNGIARRKLLDFTPVGFGSELVPATPLKLPETTKPGTFGIYYRGTNDFLTWIAKPPAQLNFQAKAGVIYGTQGNAKFSLFPALEPEGKSVADGQTIPDKMDHPLELTTTFQGLHRLQASGGGGFNLQFPADFPFTVESSPEHPFHLYGRWTAYFYVPKGTKIVGGFASGPGTVKDGSGKEVFKFDAKPNYFSIPVPAGQDGKAWSFVSTAGARHLMTVPPYLARTTQELLLPKEVVEKDSK